MTIMHYWFSTPTDEDVERARKEIERVRLERRDKGNKFVKRGLRLQWREYQAQYGNRSPWLIWDEYETKGAPINWAEDFDYKALRAIEAAWLLINVELAIFKQHPYAGKPRAYFNDN